MKHTNLNGPLTAIEEGENEHQDGGDLTLKELFSSISFTTVQSTADIEHDKMNGNSYAFSRYNSVEERFTDRKNN